jgi:hypothetical protein
VPNATVSLVNSDGNVVATTQTGRDGRYQFTDIGETGNYQVVVTAPAGFQLVSRGTQPVSITRGDVIMQGVNFGLRLVNRFFGGPGKVTVPSFATSSLTGPTSIVSRPQLSQSLSTSNSALAFAHLGQSSEDLPRFAVADVIAASDRSQPSPTFDVAIADPNGTPMLDALMGLADARVGRAPAPGAAGPMWRA